jgi:hypothetical protein
MKFIQATRHARRVYVGGLPPTANEQVLGFNRPSLLSVFLTIVVMTFDLIYYFLAAGFSIIVTTA